MRIIAFGLITLLSSLVQAQDLPRTLYAVNSLARTMSKVNLENGIITNDILTLGDVPNRIKAQGTMLYVVNSLPPGITAIDARTDQITRQIPLPEGGNPWTMAFVGPDRAYISNLVANTISVIELDTGNLRNTISVGTAPEGILVVDSLAYVTNTGGWPAYDPATVSIIHTATDSVIKTLDVAANPQDLALAPDGRIHVICTGNYGDLSGKVYIIDPAGAPDATAAVVDSVTIGGFPGDIVITRDNRAFIPDYGDGTNGFLYIYDVLTKLIDFDAANPLRIGGGAMNAFYDPERDELYVNNFDGDAVQRIDATADTVITTYPLGDGVVDMVVVGPLFATAVDQRELWVPQDFELRQNYPNPFNPVTRIEFSLASADQVIIRVYDTLGNLVRTLIDGRFAPGSHHVLWDGTNDKGESVGSGIYFYEMRFGGHSQAKMLVLAK